MEGDLLGPSPAAGDAFGAHLSASVEAGVERAQGRRAVACEFLPKHRVPSADGAELAVHLEAAEALAGEVLASLGQPCPEVALGA